MFDTIIKILLTLAVAGILIALLPVSPFPAIISSIGDIPYLGVINWFIPVSDIITLITGWAAAVLGYFVIAWILRQLDIIG